MADAGVRGSEVTAEQWLDVWEGNGHRRMDAFKAFVGTVGDLVSALRDKLRSLVDQQYAAKAAVAELEDMKVAALALGDREVLDRVLEAVALARDAVEWSDWDARQLRIQARKLGIDLKEGIDR